jgi:hypothetical protein
VTAGHRTSKNVFINLGQTIGTQTKLRVGIEFRHDVPRYTYRISGLSPIPTTRADRIAALRSALNTDATQPDSLFASTHPFPMYERYGQSSIDDFVDNLSWQFSVAHGTLICVGTQHQYTVIVPITDPPDLATGDLIFNFFPPAGSAASPLNNLLTSDSDLFYTA